MRKHLGLVAALILTAAALAAPRPGSAYPYPPCLVQCQSAYSACSLQCAGDQDCVLGCMDQREACDCNVCHYCI